MEVFVALKNCTILLYFKLFSHCGVCETIYFDCPWDVILIRRPGINNNSMFSGVISLSVGILETF